MRTYLAAKARRALSRRGDGSRIRRGGDGVRAANARAWPIRTTWSGGTARNIATATPWSAAGC